MFIEVQETDGDTVWLNTSTITFIRDSPDEDFLTVNYRYGDLLYINRCEKKKILAALRRADMLVDSR